MRIRCLGCGKSVSSEVPDCTVVRAAVWCPECIEGDQLLPLAQLRESLQAIEWAGHTRYGRVCPACRGHKEEDPGYVERGPDRGHETGCWLRASLDAMGDVEAKNQRERDECLGKHGEYPRGGVRR